MPSQNIFCRNEVPCRALAHKTSSTYNFRCWQGRWEESRVQRIDGYKTIK